MILLISKFDYFFGRMNSNPYNKIRTETMAMVMKQLGVTKL